MGKTVRRDKLLRLAQKGRLVMVSSYHYDDMTGVQSSKEAIPVRIRKSGEQVNYDGLVAWLGEWEFDGASGRAYESDDGSKVHLHVHSNCFYDFLILSEKDAKAVEASLVAKRAAAKAEREVHYCVAACGRPVETYVKAGAEEHGYCAECAQKRKPAPLLALVPSLPKAEPECCGSPEAHEEWFKRAF